MANHHSLEAQILVVFQRALMENRVDVAEHLLCALEMLDPSSEPGSPLSEAFLSVAKDVPSLESPLPN